MACQGKTHQPKIFNLAQGLKLTLPWWYLFKDKHADVGPLTHLSHCLTVQELINYMFLVPMAQRSPLPEALTG